MGKEGRAGFSHLEMIQLSIEDSFFLLASFLLARTHERRVRTGCHSQTAFRKLYVEIDN